MRHGKYPFIIGFLAVPVALYVTFVVAAYLQTFQLALTDWSGLGPITYVGFDNFVTMWNDDLFWRSVQHNLFLLLALPIITIAIALVFDQVAQGGAPTHRVAGSDKNRRALPVLAQ